METASVQSMGVDDPPVRHDVAVLLGFPVALTSAAAKVWLLPYLKKHGIKEPQFLCKAGSKSCRLQFPAV